MENTYSDEEADDVGALLPNLKEVAIAKEKDPMMFVSGFDADEDGIEPSKNTDDPGERLLQASEDGDMDLLHQLLGTDPGLVSYRDSDNYTALHRACYEDNLDIARALLYRGAKVDVRSNDGWTPLHSACHWNAHKCARMLLENGADINAQTDGGQTPLHLACSKGGARETVIILLTEPGIQINVLNKANETAYQVARRSGPLDDLFEIHRPSFSRI
ncbi:Ankyrin repeat domain-containing protein 49 [Orchesella cincta]|uniref:Ankyrin repeat domain-containing protein 49 n=1 Tax=Orchesella cincta TaxID=48709 RepID=A0A1D2N1X1_ORCCI|nr:Ankyrin repeat domain-containing protein 49 [Orchesella cincta]